MFRAWGSRMSREQSGTNFHIKDSIEMFNGAYYSPAKDKCIEI